MTLTSATSAVDGSLPRPLAGANDPACLDGIALVVVDACAGEAFRPDRRKPGSDAEADADLHDTVRVVILVLVLPHTGRHVEDIAGFPWDPLALHLGVAFALD